MKEFSKISKMLKSFSKNERYVIVEDGEPAWVVMSFKDYEAMSIGKTEVTKGQNKKKEEKKDALECCSETEAEEEGGFWFDEDEDQDTEGLFFTDDLEDLDEENCDEQDGAEKEYRYYQDIPF